MKLSKLSVLLNTLFFTVIFFTSHAIQANPPPEEFEGEQGLSTAFAGGGITFLRGLDVLSLNPALLAFKERYTVLGNYMMPRQGRHHYSLGVLDFSKKAFAGGVSYSSLIDSYDGDNPNHKSRTKYRLRAGLAHTFGKVAFGASVQLLSYFEVASIIEKKVYLFNGGFVLPLISKKLTLAGSVENLGNDKVKNDLNLLQIYRGGLSLSFMKKKLNFLIDYKQTENSSSNINSKFVIAGVYLKPLKYLSLMGAYAHHLDNKPEERLYSTGVSLLSKKVEFNYGVKIKDQETEKRKVSHHFGLSYHLK